MDRKFNLDELIKNSIVVKIGYPCPFCKGENKFINDPEKNDFVVAKDIDEAIDLAKEKSGNKNLTKDNLRQEEDVLDTWFSSWLWPISVFDGINNPENEDFIYYYPTSDLVTGPDILFFWVSRMIIAGYEFKKEKMFRYCKKSYDGI